MRRDDVLIIGAGPTGLVLALWLTRLGVTVRLIDKTDGPGTTSRALAVQARTLELYRQLDLTDAVLQRGHRVPGINLWVRGKAAARVSFEGIAGNLSPYGPFVFPQDLHERLLIERLAASGVSVERNTELLCFSETADGVNTVLRGPAGHEEVCETRYLAGCDGARSVVRQGIGARFPGGTYEQLFYVADVDAEGPALDGELHVDLDEADFLAVFPLKGQGRARLIGTVRGDRAADAENLRFEDVSARAIEHMKLKIRTVNWFSTYHVHHRVADRFRHGRIFLLGDAAHIHSPAGGQGMNTGIGDAINLAWKLASVLAGRASARLLDTYQVERRAFALTLVATTDRGFTLATAESALATWIRTRILPGVVPVLFKMPAVRRYLFRAVSQLVVAYRNSDISQGRAGRIHAGDRLPWAKGARSDNFEVLTAPQWQLHVYGSAAARLSQWCASRVVLHAFEWEPAHATAGFARDAMYLVRPDGYVACVSAQQDPAQIERYLATHALNLVL